MKFKIFIEKLKSVKKSTWIFWSVMLAFIVLAIVLGIVAMYLSGYTLIAWISQFYPWLIFGIAILIIIVASVVYWKYRRK